MDNFKDATEEEKNQVMQDVQRALLFLVTNNINMIRLADMRRSKLRAALQRGEKPHDHRTKFLYEASGEIFGWLGQKAKEFQEKYPFDTFVVGDINDVLVMAQKRLKSFVAQEAVEEEPKKPTSAS